MRWLQASRPLAHVNIALPLLYGQAFAYAVTGRFSWAWFAIAHVYGVLNHLTIVFSNDYADREADRANASPTWLSGGSRVIPQGKILPRRLLRAAYGTTAGMIVLSAGVAWTGGRWAMVLLTACALGLAHTYSFRPLRISYRGYGEWLQGLGTGVVLPLVGYVMQARSILDVPWTATLPTLLLGVASNVLTALPDTPADQAVGKRTFPVRRGERVARSFALTLVFVAAVSPLLGHRRATDVVFLATPIVACVFLVAAALLWRTADSSNRARCLGFIVLVQLAIVTLFLGWSASLFIRGAGA